MSQKHSDALRRYWATVSPEERSRKASLMAKRRYESMTPDERRRHMERMTAAASAKIAKG